MARMNKLHIKTGLGQFFNYLMAESILFANRHGVKVLFFFGLNQTVSEKSCALSAAANTQWNAVFNSSKFRRLPMLSLIASVYPDYFSISFTAHCFVATCLLRFCNLLLVQTYGGRTCDPPEVAQQRGRRRPQLMNVQNTTVMNQTRINGCYTTTMTGRQSKRKYYSSMQTFGCVCDKMAPMCGHTIVIYVGKCEKKIAIIKNISGCDGVSLCSNI